MSSIPRIFIDTELLLDKELKITDKSFYNMILVCKHLFDNCVHEVPKSMSYRASEQRPQGSVWEHFNWVDSWSIHEWNCHLSIPSELQEALLTACSQEIAQLFYLNFNTGVTNCPDFSA